MATSESTQNFAAMAQALNEIGAPLLQVHPTCTTIEGEPLICYPGECQTTPSQVSRDSVYEPGSVGYSQSSGSAMFSAEQSLSLSSTMTQVRDYTYKSWTERSTESVLAFQGRDHPFHPEFFAHFQVGGFEFHSIHQFVQYKKALFYGSPELAEQIMNTYSPVQVPILAEQVQALHPPACFHRVLWHQIIAKCFMLIAVMAALGQNNYRKTQLLRSQQKTLHFCENSGSKFWSAGHTLDEPECLQPQMCPGHNHYGIILMIARAMAVEKP